MILALIPYIMPLIILAFTAFVTTFIPEFLTMLLSFIPDLMGNQSQQIMHYTGFAAWVAIKFRFADCLTVIMTWLGIRTAISMIPVMGKLT